MPLPESRCRREEITGDIRYRATVEHISHSAVRWGPSPDKGLTVSLTHMARSSGIAGYPVAS